MNSKKLHLGIKWDDLAIVCEVAWKLALIDGKRRVVVRHPERWNLVIRVYPDDLAKMQANKEQELFWTL